MIINVVYGFLGAGKTTFIRYLLEHPPRGEKLVILVNEFGEVGVDGLTLSGRGADIADVVEMPSGCICCTMASDFRRQIIELHKKFSPDRMIIEPTGVATISQIMSILDREDLEALYSDIRLIHILDGSEFLSFIKSHRYFMENQLRAGNLVILNKTDRIKPSVANLLVSSVKEINPEARVFPTSFAKLEPSVLEEIFDTDYKPAPENREKNPREDAQTHHDQPHEHGHDHEDEAHGLARKYRPFGLRYPEEVFQPECLSSFFESLRDQKYGDVVRAKGIFRSPGGWIRMELASGEVSIAKNPVGEESLVSVIGQFMNTPKLEAGLKACQI